MDFLKKSEFAQLLQSGCQVVDTRNTESFSLGFIEGALSVPFGNEFLNKLNDLVTGEIPLVFVVNEEELPAVFKTVKASGLKNVNGYYTGNYETWQAEGLPVDILITIEADEFAADYRFDEFYLIDIRPKAEYVLEHAEDSENIALNDLEQYLVDLDVNESYYLYGSNAEDAVTAGSLFKKTGFQRVRSVVADIETIKKAGIPWFKPKKNGSAEK
jgi:rhodanese-related sulfurtransferase